MAHSLIRPLTGTLPKRLEESTASAALLRMLEVSWQVVERQPILRQERAVAETPEEDGVRHAPVADRLQRLIERGQRDGEFDADAAATWLVAAVIALGHAAGAEAAAGRMSAAESHAALCTGVL